MTLSALISLVLVLIVLGFCLWLLERYIPQDSVMLIVIRAVIALGIVLWLLSFLGVWHGVITR